MMADREHSYTKYAECFSERSSFNRCMFEMKTNKKENITIDAQIADAKPSIYSLCHIICIRENME